MSQNQTLHMLFFTPLGKTRSFLIKKKWLKHIAFTITFFMMSGIFFLFWSYSQWQQKNNLFAQLKNLREEVFLEQVDVLANHDLNYFLEESMQQPKNIVADEKKGAFSEWSWIEKNAEKLTNIQVVDINLTETDECWNCRFEVRNLDSSASQTGIVDVQVWYEDLDGTFISMSSFPLSEGLRSGKRYSFQNFAYYELQGNIKKGGRLVRARLVFKDLKGRQLVIDPLSKNAMT